MERGVESKFKTKTGWLCLDFANTVEWHASDQPEEKLSSYADLVSWAEQTQIVDPDIAKKLVIESEKEPARAQDVLKEAIKIREAIYHIFLNISLGGQVDERDLSTLNTAINKMMPNQRISIKDGNFSWDWTINVEKMDSILWPVVWSAAQLLTSHASKRVGQCADEKCGWLFWDNSRNRSRRWCDMRDCGNRAKSRRHYKKCHDQQCETNEIG